MSTVVAALDTTAAARPVLETALLIGELTASSIEAVHVRSDSVRSAEIPESLATRYGVPFRLLEGDVKHLLLGAFDRPEVVAAVIGARSTPGGRRPVGRTARHLLERANKPVVVVPPDYTPPTSLRRLLVPLEGNVPSSGAVLDKLAPLLTVDAELLALHVFTDLTVPSMLDRPSQDLDMWGREFLYRHLPQGSGIVLRPGPVAARVAEVSREHDADMIVLSWSQSPSPDRARVIRDVLANSVLPVLLLPAAAEATGPT